MAKCSSVGGEARCGSLEVETPLQEMSLISRGDMLNVRCARLSLALSLEPKKLNKLLFLFVKAWLVLGLLYYVNANKLPPFGGFHPRTQRAASHFATYSAAQLWLVKYCV